MYVNPGELNKKIEIIEHIQKKDQDGFELEWDEKIIRKPWVKFERISGKKKLEVGIEMAEEKVRFLARYSRFKITKNMKIRYDGKLYEIEYVNNYGDDNRYEEYMCKGVE